MAQSKSTWWHSLTACPSCGSPVFLYSDYPKGKCEQCGRGFKLNNNVLQWDETNQVTPMAQLSVLMRRLRSFLHPVSSPFLPFRYLGQVRLERFYNRTLQDSYLARKWADHYLDGLDLPSGAAILDFGCGRGRNIGILNQLGYRVVGQDMDSQPWWHRLACAGFQVVSDFSYLPWRDASFDLLLQVQVINYLSESQLQEHVARVRNLLKPGGFWLLLEPNEQGAGAQHIRKHYGRLHPLADLRALTANHGFIELDHSFEGYYAPYFPIVINFIRKICMPRRFDLSDYDSWLATKIRPERRGLWLLRLKRSNL